MNSRKCTKPIRMWIDGKCYNIRKYDKTASSKFHRDVAEEEKQKSVGASIQFHLPITYYNQLDRCRGPEINIIESKTNTIIKYPKYGKDGVIEISGDSKESMEEAREQLHSIIADMRESESAMQFIAIPLLCDEIKKNFEDFKGKVLAENHQGVEESIFQSALKLHLTVVVFRLLNDAEKKVAIETLEECKSFFINTAENSKPMKIKVKGLNCMNTNLSKVNVLYAETSFTDDSKSTSSLQEIVNSISNLFYEKGLVQRYQENVKLHLTLMNTKYRNKKEGSPKKRWVKKEPFDATKIIQQYKDYYFGEANVDTIHLSLISSKGEDGFYKSIASVKF